MLRSLLNKTTRLVSLQKTPLKPFANDWSKDREKAAEKEFTIRDEKEKMKKIKARLQDAKSDVKLSDPLQNVDNVEELLKDREYLVV